MDEKQLDEHIKACGSLVEQSHAIGDRTSARYWLGEMAGSIAARTPEHVARLERERGLSKVTTESHA